VLAGGIPGKINSFNITKFPGKKELRGFAPIGIME
jgi:hypothetical protein